MLTFFFLFFLRIVYNSSVLLQLPRPYGWSVCSVSFGTGQIKRTRVWTSGSCSGDPTETQECSINWHGKLQVWYCKSIRDIYPELDILLRFPQINFHGLSQKATIQIMLVSSVIVFFSLLDIFIHQMEHTCKNQSHPRWLSLSLLIQQTTRNCYISFRDL